jgi:serine/threonine-protein kinase HipA
MEKTIYVYENCSSSTPVLLGRLYINQMRRNESYSFEYSDEWLRNSDAHRFLDPDLMLYRGRQYTPLDKSLFGLFADSCPDRWGRLLMQRREAITAQKEGRKPQKLNESDYLLGVYDAARMGALRFSLEEGGQFESSDEALATPPWVSLRKLESASIAFENDDSGLEEKWLNQLLAPGSSLGGARPKATVQDVDGSLWIAKFPSKHDDYNSGAWEMTAHELARLCRLNVPEARLESFSSTGDTFIVKRFDRVGEKRIHFSSAMTLLGQMDGATGSSYLDIVDFIKMNGANPKNDLIELWKRIVFNMAITNSDDHLRNHGFILTNTGWQLSPLYDVNPVPYGDTLSLNVSEDDNSIDIELALETAAYYDISFSDAEAMAQEILSTVRDNWERVAKENGLSREAILRMKPAFSECYLDF